MSDATAEPARFPCRATMMRWPGTNARGHGDEMHDTGRVVAAGRRGEQRQLSGLRHRGNARAAIDGEHLTGAAQPFDAGPWLRLTGPFCDDRADRGWARRPPLAAADPVAFIGAPLTRSTTGLSREQASSCG